MIHITCTLGYIFASGGNPGYVNTNEDQKTSIHVAAEAGNRDAVQALLMLGAVVDSLEGVSFCTALHLASSNAHSDTAKVLLHNGASVNAANAYGNTPLHLVCGSSSIETIELVILLLSHGADPCKRNKKGSTALHFLCLNTDAPSSLLQSIVQAGADIDAVDSRGMTPLLSCCTSGRGDFLAALIHLGATVLVKDGEGRDAKNIAAFHGHNELISLLLSP